MPAGKPLCVEPGMMINYRGLWRIVDMRDDDLFDMKFIGRA